MILGIFPEGKEARVAKRLESLAKSIGIVMGERKKLERIEKRLASALNKALGRLGYKVVSVKGAAPARRQRRRARRAKPAGRPRRRAGARRRRGRARRN